VNFRGNFDALLFGELGGYFFKQVMGHIWSFQRELNEGHGESEKPRWKIENVKA
jgi:hypothetical protein